MSLSKEEIIRMALDAGAMPVRGEPKQLAIVTNLMIERFAALVAAAEREACAKVCEEIGPKGVSFDLITQGFAGAIRARGNGGVQ